MCTARKRASYRRNADGPSGDIEISPFDNTVFVCHTNNDNHGNIHGHITRILKQATIWPPWSSTLNLCAGGRQSGFSSPDNLAFDSNGDLWVVRTSPAPEQRRSQILYEQRTVCNSNKRAGSRSRASIRLRSGRVRAYRPILHPDEQTLFLSVQHPGENTEDLSKPTSTWPHRSGENMARALSWQLAASNWNNTNRKERGSCRLAISELAV